MDKDQAKLLEIVLDAAADLATLLEEAKDHDAAFVAEIRRGIEMLNTFFADDLA